MDVSVLEKLSLLAALAIAVIYLWRGYVAARDETIAELRKQNAALLVDLERCLGDETRV